MRQKLLSKLIFMVGVLLCTIPTFACTEMHYHSGHTMITARNMDWYSPEGFIVINPRGEEHRGISLPSGKMVSRWVSKYGSVTFDMGDQSVSGQDGINEKGLSAALLWLSPTQYAAPNHHLQIPSGFWVQYLLDNFASVDEVIAAMPTLNVISMEEPEYHLALKQHVIVTDATGNSAVLEYLHGNLVIHQGNPLSTPVLTNHPYEVAIDALPQYAGFGGKIPRPKGPDSLARFVRAAWFIQSTPFPKQLSKQITTAFEGLSYVMQQPMVKNKDGKLEASAHPTRWSVVRDLTHRVLYFRTENDSHIRKIDLSQINFAANQPVRRLPITAKVSGDILQRFTSLRK